ncbi:MAG: iron ABC transporter permease [Alphaproteobacteria bacterium]|nr:iron ABC transporter permease [Alphaproteobacteria bacterium]
MAALEETQRPPGPLVRRWRRPRFDAWTAGAVVLALVVASPIVAVFAMALASDEGVWRHLVSTVMPEYLYNTFRLFFGVAIGVLLAGVGPAWLVSMCRFPGRNVFEWALLLPLAVPAYVIAFVYTDLLEYAGPVQVALRSLFGWTSARDYWFPDIRSLDGAIAMMSLVFYPYVYLLTRAAFVSQSVCLLEASRVLGRGPWRSFFTVALPLARPAIVAGLSLALMETLADFGTVEYFAVDTFTTGIYRVWLDVNEPAAAQMAATLFVLVLALIWIERRSRRDQRYHQTTTRYRELPGYRLAGWRKWAAVAVCALPILLGFAVPAVVLGDHAWANLARGLDARFVTDLWNSLMLAGLAGVVCIAAAVFLAYGVRLNGGRLLAGLTRFASIGYAIPGSVLAVGAVPPLARLDHAIDAAMEASFGISTGLIFSGTVAALIFAYVVRFMALANGAVDSALTRVTPSMDGAARSLGAGPAGTLLRVHLPLIRGGVLAGATLVFVEVLKELPATILLRPFNFQTLATRAYEYASDERIAEAALPALTIVLAGIIPVIILSRAIRKSRPGHREG